MAKEEQLLSRVNPFPEEEIKELIKSEEDELKSSEISEPKLNSLEEILKQRRDHRDRLLGSMTKLMWASFLLLASLLGIQSLVRIIFIPYLQDFTLLDGWQLQILSVSIFGQIVAVVFVISKALWDDKNYMDLFKD